MSGPVLAIVGPTAAGKTALALEVAAALDAEVVSMDSALVYRGMDIGTDKPSPPELARVAHHLVDVVPPSHTLTVSEFQSMARAAVANPSSVQARAARSLRRAILFCTRLTWRSRRLSGSPGPRRSACP